MEGIIDVTFITKKNRVSNRIKADASMSKESNARQLEKMISGNKARKYVGNKAEPDRSFWWVRF